MNKKLFKYVILVSLFCMIIFCFKVVDMELNNNLKLVNATPITNKVVVIDAGHGLPDEGAMGYFGTTEQAINLEIALKLQKIIEQSGAKVYLTRSDENGIYSAEAKTIREKKISDSKNRVEIANAEDVDVCISIHLNKFQESSSYSGWQTFYKKNDSQSQSLAMLIQNNLNKNINIENDRKSLAIDNVYLMKKIEKPMVIVECGFLSNEAETKKLKKEEYQNKLVWGIYLGIQDYFSKNEVKKDG